MELIINLEEEEKNIRKCTHRLRERGERSWFWCTSTRRFLETQTMLLLKMLWKTERKMSKSFHLQWTKGLSPLTPLFAIAFLLYAFVFASNYFVCEFRFCFILSFGRSLISIQCFNIAIINWCSCLLCFNTTFPTFLLIFKLIFIYDSFTFIDVDVDVVCVFEHFSHSWKTRSLWF